MVRLTDVELRISDWHQNIDKAMSERKLVLLNQGNR